MEESEKLDRYLLLAWRDGNLRHKLDPLQRRARTEIWKRLDRPFGRYVLNWARRTGKTWLLMVIAFEVAIRKRRARINVASSTKDSLREIVWPIVDDLLLDCPKSLQPKLQEMRGRIVFPNGSVIVLGSCDNRRTVGRLRGRKADLNIIEEGGTIPDKPGLRYVLTAVLNPQLMTTQGATLMALTPPDSPGHEAVPYALQAKANGNYSHATLADNPRISKQIREQYLKADADALGMTVDEYLRSADYRREWQGEFIADPSRAVLPGFVDEAEREIIRPLDACPLFADRYVAMDIGWSPDFTGILFGFWNYILQTLVIEHELLVRRMSPLELGQQVKVIEEKLWAKRWTGHISRVADMPDVLFRDFAQQYDLVFIKTDKDDRDAAIAAVDVWIRKRKIQILPYDEATGLGCRALPVQMRVATHNTHRTDFERTAEHGHVDLVAALIYLVRNVRKHEGRPPEGWGMGPESWRNPDASKPAASNVRSLRKLMGD